MFYRWNRNLRAGKKKAEFVQVDLKGRGTEVREMTKVESQALSTIKHFGVYNRDPRGRDVFHASVSAMEIHVWKKRAT